MTRARLLLLWLTFVATGIAAEPLDILVYGASGKVGSHIVDEALERGHRVTAVSRDPARIAVVHENLVVRQGDLLDLASIASLLAGHDVVVISVRGVIGDIRGANALQNIAVRNVAECVRRTEGERPRLINIGGAATLEVAPGVTYADKIGKIFVSKSLEAEFEGQFLALEFLRSAADIDWTYVTPAKHFTDGARTGSYRVGGDAMMKDAKGRSRISRADFAVAVVDEIESGAHVGRRFSVAY